MNISKQLKYALSIIYFNDMFKKVKSCSKISVNKLIFEKININKVQIYIHLIIRTY